MSKVHTYTEGVGIERMTAGPSRETLQPVRRMPVVHEHTLDALICAINPIRAMKEKFPLLTIELSGDDPNPLDTARVLHSLALDGKGGRSARRMSSEMGWSFVAEPGIAAARKRLSPRHELGVISESTVDSGDVGIVIHSHGNTVETLVSRMRGRMTVEGRKTLDDYRKRLHDYCGKCKGKLPGIGRYYSERIVDGIEERVAPLLRVHSWEET